MNNLANQESMIAAIYQNIKLWILNFFLLFCLIMKIREDREADNSIL